MKLSTPITYGFSLYNFLKIFQQLKKVLLYNQKKIQNFLRFIFRVMTNLNLCDSRVTK